MTQNTYNRRIKILSKIVGVGLSVFGLWFTAIALLNLLGSESGSIGYYLESMPLIFISGVLCLVFSKRNDQITDYRKRTRIFIALFLFTIGSVVWAFVSMYPHQESTGFGENLDKFAAISSPVIAIGACTFFFVKIWHELKKARPSV